MKTKELFKPFIDDIKPYVPGKPIKEVQKELGLKSVIKLASNENPLGPSPKAVKAIQKLAAGIHFYPDGGCVDLRMKLAKHLRVSDNQIVIGNGSNEIIEFLIKGFVNSGDQVISSELSFLVYELVTRTAGAQFIEVPMQDFRYDLKAIANKINAKTKLIFIANPNNPTGTYLTRQEMESFLKKVPKEVIVCLDEAYVDFVTAKNFPNALSLLKKYSNLVILRTFSKSYGLAGLRVGFGIASKEMIGYFNKIRQPFNVNLMAQQAALAALDDARHLERTIEVNLKGRAFLYKALDQLELSYLSSEANFVLVDVDRDADQVFNDLLKQGIVIRSMKAYGLPSSIRISIGLMKENKMLIHALKNVLEGN